MWILYAVGSAFFAGVTSILAKSGIKKTDSNVATAIRTIVVFIFSWIMVFVVGSQASIKMVGQKTLLFLILSGLATGASWLCYFHALQIGDINKVVPIDKSSTVLTIVLALIFLKEGITWQKSIAVILIAIGIFLMIQKKSTAEENDSNGKSWLFYAVLSAVFASLTAVLGKIGITGIESNLGTAIRTGIVLVMAWSMVFITGKQSEIHNIDRRELIFICCSGIATGASWMYYYKALQNGPESVVIPIDKSSVLVTVAFSYFIFHESLDKKSAIGLALLVLGTIIIAIL